MKDVQALKELLTAMSRAEKAELLRLVIRDLEDIFPGIESIPGIRGGEPCIVRTRIPVWFLEQARRLGATESEILKSYPSLTAGDLVNAWVSVDVNRTQIDKQILENEEA